MQKETLKISSNGKLNIFTYCNVIYLIFKSFYFYFAYLTFLTKSFERSNAH